MHAAYYQFEQEINNIKLSGLFIGLVAVVLNEVCKVR